MPLMHQAKLAEDIGQEHTVERVGITIIIKQGLQMQVVEARQTHTYATLF